jgi:SHS2 domain-containing protein
MYQWTESGTEIELEIEDESPAAVFREAVVALGDLLTEERGGESMTHIVILSAPDVSALLRAWIEELTRLDESDGFVPERMIKLQLTDASLTATVGGQRLEHPSLVEDVVSADLVCGRDGVWTARVVLRRTAAD